MIEKDEVIVEEKSGEKHVPVMVSEVMDLLNPERGGLFLDGTVGLGGHAEEILKRSSPSGRLIAMDIDESAVRRAEERLKEFANRVRIVYANFASFDTYLMEGESGFDGVLLDLGLSTEQVFSHNRGFSFMKSGPLDMRMDKEQSFTARNVVNEYPYEELLRIFKEYGEEMKAEKIAREIVRRRREKPIEYTDELVEIVARCIRRRGKIHPATKVFQAIRIEVNRELDNLKLFLAKLPFFMKNGGRVVVISFHSLEDRIVKERFIMWEERSLGRRLTLKPLVPSLLERKVNPRSRSAKLRGFLFEK